MTLRVLIAVYLSPSLSVCLSVARQVSFVMHNSVALLGRPTFLSADLGFTAILSIFLFFFVS